MNRQDNTLLLKNSHERRIYEASIDEGLTTPLFEIQTLTLDLSTAKLRTQAKEVGFPFRSVYVVSASDSATYLNFLPNTFDEYQSPVPLYKKDSMDFGKPIAKSFLYWPAQASKEITLLFFVNASFKPGNFLVTSTPDVEATSVTSKAGIATAATAFSICAADPDRRITTVYNAGSYVVYLGSSSVTMPSGAFPGIPLAPGDILKYRNVAALYGIASGVEAKALYSMDEK